MASSVGTTGSGRPGPLSRSTGTPVYSDTIAVDLLALEHLALQQRAGDAVEHRAVVVHDLLGATVGALDQALDLAVDLDRGRLRVVLVAGELLAEEDRLLALAEGQRPELGHAPLAHHLAGELGGTLEVVAGAGRDLAPRRTRSRSASRPPISTTSSSARYAWRAGSGPPRGAAGSARAPGRAG